jgi:hypothetical protein
MHTDRCDNTNRQNYHATGSRNETKIQEFLYGGATNLEHEMCMVIPVIIGTTGTVKKGFQKSLEAIAGK